MTQAKRLPTSESLVELESAHEPPCLSLYQPTHRRHPENQQDPIRFHNLVKELLLDDLAELIGKMGGRTLVVPAEQMPGRTGLAATYRY